MTMTLDELEAQRDAIRRAIRSGVLRVRHGDKEVEYRSVADLQKALDDVQSQIADVGGTRRSRFRYHKTCKALG